MPGIGDDIFGGNKKVVGGGGGGGANSIVPPKPPFEGGMVGTHDPNYQVIRSCQISSSFYSG